LERCGGAGATALRSSSCWSPSVLVEAPLVQCSFGTLGQFQAFLERREGVGDVAFAAAGDGAVTFVVANLVVLVRTVDGPPTPVTGPVHDVERHIRARPEPGGRVAPEIHERAAGAPQPDGTVPIEVKTADPPGRPLWFKVFGHGGEVFDGTESSNNATTPKPRPTSPARSPKARPPAKHDAPSSATSPTSSTAAS
jgi:hypothetical protein